MNQARFETNDGKELLAQIREGMEVYDQSGEKIGIVERVVLGEVDADVDEEELGGLGVSTWHAAGRKPGGKGLGQILEDAFDEGDELTDSVRDHLLGEGFIRVGGGGLRGQVRYITPDLIQSVSDDRVKLKVSKAQILRQ